jgi:ferritin-like metal-binding protein YciE
MMMKPNSLHELYVEQLRDLYDGEHQIIKALPKMIEKATSADLKEALNEHLEVTKDQATRIERIFGNLGEEPKAEKCKGIQGIIDEGDDLIGDIKDADVRDAAIIASAQRVEHYEMAGYGTARTYATLLEEQDASQLLQETLDEEKQADQRLTSLANKINVNAAAAGKSVEGEELQAGTGRHVA